MRLTRCSESGGFLMKKPCRWSANSGSRIMNALLQFLNSNFGVLISGAVISGIIVQYITLSWQRRSWIFQQRYMAEKATFDKELDQKYKLLEDINTAVAAVLAHSRFALAAYVKSVPPEQLNQQISSYNDAVLKWESDFE